MPTRVIDYPNRGGSSKPDPETPNVHERVETGPTQFGDDWTGLFIRGDDAFGLALEIKQLREWYAELSNEDKKSPFIQRFPAMCLRSISNYEKIIFEEVVEACRRSWSLKKVE